MKLYEINEEILACVDSETGEIIDPEKLNNLLLTKSEKLENLALWYKDLIAESEALKAEKEAFAAREKAAKNKAESIKNYLSFALQGESFKTTKCVVSFRKSEKTIVDDIAELPEEYLTIAEPKANLTEIKKAIKNGEEIKGAHIEETQNIQIK